MAHGPSSTRRLHLEELPEYAQHYHEVRTSVPGTMQYTAHWNRTLLDLLPPAGPLRALDLMCGEGVFLQSLASRYHVVGLDISMPLLELVPRQQRGSVVRGDALALPFPRASFDVVVVRGALHHLPDALGSVFAEVQRVMRDDGAFLLLEPSDDNPVIRIVRRGVYGTLSHFAEHERGLTSAELAHHLATNNFILETTRRSGFLAYMLLLNTDAHWLLRWLNSLPGARAVANVLIACDRVWESPSALSRFTFNVIMAARLRRKT